MIIEPGADEAHPATGPGQLELLDPTQVPVQATGAVSGETYTVRPGSALGAEAQQSSQAATQGRFVTSEARQTGQFQSQQYQEQKRRADDAANEVSDLLARADADENALHKLQQKKAEQGGTLWGDDARDEMGYESRAQMYRNQAKAKGDVVRRSYGDFYDIGNDGVPRPKAAQPPATPQPQTTGPKPRLQVDHAKFEKMYSEAKTPEERSKLMRQYQQALKAAQ
jgi:hypothetical protein